MKTAVETVKIVLRGPTGEDSIEAELTVCDVLPRLPDLVHWRDRIFINDGVTDERGSAVYRLASQSVITWYPEPDGKFKG